MQKKCSLCGREKVPSRDSETKMQIRQTTRHMDEIEKTSEISTSCKQALESRITGDVERKASLKKRYLELLRNKEAVKQRLFKRERYQLQKPNIHCILTN